MPFTLSIVGAADIGSLAKKRRRVSPAPPCLACLPADAQPASLAQSRFGSFFSAAYFSAELRIIGLRMLLSACSTPGCTTHFLPSQVWILAWASPEWLTQLVLTGVMKPVKPSFLIAASSIDRFSRPQRTSSPLSGFLPYLTCALRTPSTAIIADTMPRL